VVIPARGRSLRFRCPSTTAPSLSVESNSESNGNSAAATFNPSYVVLSSPCLPEELPLFDYDLLEFFDILGVENSLQLIVCILLEHQVLVYSSDVDKLMLVCESAIELCYPFAWQHVYVPVLPPNLEAFLDAPVPYIMGLLRRDHDVELSKKGSVCIVDIDSGELELPEEVTLITYHYSYYYYTVKHYMELFYCYFII